MLTRRRQVIRILANVLRAVSSDWRLVGKKSLSIVCAKQSIDVDIEDSNRWLDPTTQHVQFWTGGRHLFLSFAVIASERKTFKNIKRAFVYALNFVQCPTAYQMSKIAFDSIAIGCFYDNVTFKQPHANTEGFATFSVFRTQANHDFHVRVTMWICETCGPHCEFIFVIPEEASKIYRCQSSVCVVDHCINEVTGRAFLLPQYRRAC